MLVTDVLAALLGVIGIAFVAMWLSPLEAQTLNVGHLLGWTNPDRVSARSLSALARAHSPYSSDWADVPDGTGANGSGTACASVQE